MNRIDLPDYFDDEAALDALAENDKLDDYEHLGPAVPAIKSGYVQYINSAGNARIISDVALAAKVKNKLKYLYTKPSKELTHIGRIRDESDANCCPMCGSFHSGTLDHLLPKTDYPVFAIFGPNLVPACKCNTKRGKHTIGLLPDERVLHPYFDDILSSRLFAARFEDLGQAPIVTLRPLLARADPHTAAVNFHMKHVVERTSIIDYLTKSWNQMIRRPSLAASELRTAPASRETLGNIFLNELGRQDDTHDSLNNWRSVFLAGLLDDHVLDWLFDAFQRPGWRADGPLIEGVV